MPSVTEAPRNARTKLLDAAVDLIRTKGFNATSVDELCAAAGVTKGAFFHHFESKEALGVATANHWSETTSALFADQDYHRHADPLARILAYVDFRAELLAGEVEKFTCLVGTMVQETYRTHPPIREACADCFSQHVAMLEADFAAAIERSGGRAGLDTNSLVLFTQATLQGAFILAKANDSPAVARDMVVHLKRYITMLFDNPGK